jgi:hypothetical protein
MSISTGPIPAPPKKKRGLGCFGCGCVVLGLLALLAVVVLACVGFVGYRMAMDLSSPTPPAITTFDGGDDLYQKARQKLGDFDHDVQNHQAATVRLSADELNTLLARDPNVIKNHIQVLVTMADSEGRVQAGFPTGIIPPQGWFAGRYGSIDLSFAVHLNTSTKSIEITPHALQVAGKPFLGPNAENNEQAQAMLAPYIPLLNQSLTNGIRKNTDGALLLDEAKSIEIQGSQLVIETQ